MKMPKTYKQSVLALVLGAFVAVSQNAFADDAQILNMQRNLLNLQNQVQDLQYKLAESKGQVEYLNHQIETLQAENNSLKSKLEQVSANAANTASDNTAAINANNTTTLTKVSGGGTATIKPVKNGLTQSTKPDAKAAPAEAMKLYQDSFNLLVKENLNEASKGFSTYVNKYPDNSLTPNAWYWLGQVQYKQKNYQEARVSFLNTAKFKDSTKRADALYKLGITSQALGDKEKAKKYFEVLVKSYPNSSSSILAKKELSKLQ